MMQGGHLCNSSRGQVFGPPTPLDSAPIFKFLSLNSDFLFKFSSNVTEKIDDTAILTDICLTLAP